jgi:hypothetical protein
MLREIKKPDELPRRKQRGINWNPIINSTQLSLAQVKIRNRIIRRDTLS